MPWDIVAAVLVAIFGLITFGAAINRRRRGANLLSVLFFVSITAFAVAVTIVRLHDYWSHRGAPGATATAQPPTTISVQPQPAGVLPASAGTTTTEIIYGKTIAEHNCASCHQISRDQPVPAPVLSSQTGSSVTAPSFAAIAGDPKTSAASLRAFLTLPHYPMPDRSMSVTSGDLPYLTTYILSLRSQPAQH